MLDMTDLHVIGYRVTDQFDRHTVRSCISESPGNVEVLFAMDLTNLSEKMFLEVGQRMCKQPGQSAYRRSL